MYSTLPLVRSGRLRALAVSSAERNPAAPEIPTVAESGLPGYDTFDWQGMVGPKGLPRPIVERLSAELTKILRSREISERLLVDGVLPAPSTPEAFSAFIAKEIEVVRGIVSRAGIKLD
jgi:tripartite-type tricarboxylate transporter receptor subunit TctC